MKITNRQLISIYNGTGPVRQKRLPVKVGFAISKNLSAMDGAAEAYTAEQRKILDKYCEKDGSGNYRTEDDRYVLTDQKAYTEEMNELLGIETDIQIQTVTIDEIAKCDSDKFDALTPDELSLLDFMVDE